MFRSDTPTEAEFRNMTSRAAVIAEDGCVLRSPARAARMAGIESAFDHLTEYLKTAVVGGKALKPLNRSGL
jgi:hypothetical protein